MSSNFIITPDLQKEQLCLGVGRREGRGAMWDLPGFDCVGLLVRWLGGGVGGDIQVVLPSSHLSATLHHTHDLSAV